ncbi:unnamed protein product [Rotaria socialis]|uniref:Uncharacterized protein n=1 Tax=Rotaria socialis TaxID=392032 RepID=A0A820J6K8_9BILA|nr:unnamed protein product [Rotaria socialis]CAF3420761.1 unnamed protein product [Rotaria socialis]CAF3453658.1 unnamed protein product [Rotaria socialis]CAF3474177.1 unnamed protein product [Rotaria socialis]CAF3495892.1 unnamed protein product [Rotaria socialis]
MILTILAGMSNDEQRLQLLQTIRNKLSNYNLNWLDIRNIISLFSKKNQIRFEVLQLLLLYANNLQDKIDIDDYIDLSNQSTNDNEQLKISLFEQLYQKLNIRNRKDFEPIVNLFQTITMKQKVEAMIRINRSDFILDDKPEVIGDQQLSSLQLTSFPEQTIANSILSPTSSFVQELSLAPLKRTHPFDDQYQDHCCQQIITPSSIVQQNEFIQQRDLLSSISISSSNSSLSSASDENIPIRTLSFMVAIKNTFERLKATSSS